MIQKKIIMLGSPGVGKTSLVSRFVRSTFSERYLATVGVRIDKKQIELDDQDMTLVIWDLAGNEAFRPVLGAYLRGSSGYLLIVDGMRDETLKAAISLQTEVKKHLGNIPFVLVYNKWDEEYHWNLSKMKLQFIEQKGWLTAKTSAKTGDGVNNAFLLLAQQIMGLQTPGTSLIQKSS